MTYAEEMAIKYGPVNNPKFTVETLKSLISSGHFHHATYRTDIAQGLHVYRHANEGDLGFNGFCYEASFSEGTPECEEAYKLTRMSGIYEGAYK